MIDTAFDLPHNVIITVSDSPLIKPGDRFTIDLVDPKRRWWQFWKPRKIRQEFTVS